MPAPINRLPFGLLDFLGLKTGGRYPQYLVETVQPVFDLWRQYAALNSVEFSASGVALAASAPSGNLALTTINTAGLTIVGGIIPVPQDEIWYVDQLSSACTFSANAGSDADFFPLVSVGSATNGITDNGELCGYTTSVATIIRTGRRTWRQGIFIRPGGFVALSSGGAVVGGGGSISFSLHGRIARLKV